MSDKASQQKQQAVRNTAEWVTLGISTAIVIFLIGYAVYHGITGGRAIPKVDVSARVGDAVRLGDNYAVPVTIENKSSVTAEDLHVEVEVKRQGENETREMIVDFLPENGSVEGYVVFDFKPDPSSAKAQVTNFEVP